MAVPSSGEISLGSIYNEINDNNYSSGKSTSNISLTSVSTGGSTASHAINTRNISANRPNVIAPHAMTEFYSYDHDEASIAGFMVDDFQGTPTSTRANFNSTNNILSLSLSFLRLKPNSCSEYYRNSPTVDCL